MAQEKDSIYASLRGPEEEEVVIQAGCVPSGVPCGAAAPARQRGSGESCGCDPAAAVSSDGVSRASCDMRMATTEEDLKAQVPYSGMRRAIIALAVAAVAAFVVYCRFAG